MFEVDWIWETECQTKLYDIQLTDVNKVIVTLQGQTNFGMNSKKTDAMNQLMDNVAIIHKTTEHVLVLSNYLVNNKYVN